MRVCPRRRQHKLLSGVAINARSFGAGRKTTGAVDRQADRRTETEVNIFVSPSHFAAAEARARSRRLTHRVPGLGPGRAEPAAAPGGFGQPGAPAAAPFPLLSFEKLWVFFLNQLFLN